MMEYAEHTLRPPLDRIVRCVWTLRAGGGGGEPERVVPDGCVEVIVNRADVFVREGDGGDWRAQERVMLVGQLPGAMRIVSTGEVDLVGIRFEPAGFHALTGMPMHGVTGLDVRLRDVDAALDAGVREACGARTDRAVVEGIERAVGAALLRRGHAGSDAIGFGEAAARIAERSRLTRVGDLAGELRMSARALERVFRDEIGLTPKRYLRVRRLSRVVARLGPGGAEWSDVARAHGFADQPHLVREFRLLAGVTPEAYLREQTRLMDHFASAG